MTTYCKKINNVLVPYSMADFKRENPNISLGNVFTQEQLDYYEIYPLIIESKPGIDTKTTRHVENPILFINGSYRKTWNVEPIHIDEIRDNAVIDKRTFCLVLLEMGILTASEAVDAAKNIWPASFSAMLGSVSEKEAAAAQIDWATTTVIRYRAPMLQALAMSVTDNNIDYATQLLDTIFGL